MDCSIFNEKIPIETVAVVYFYKEKKPSRQHSEAKNTSFFPLKFLKNQIPVHILGVSVNTKMCRDMFLLRNTAQVYFWNCADLDGSISK